MSLQPRLEAAGSVSVQKIRTVTGFNIPECVVVDSESDNIYISNIVTSNEGYWIDDKQGYISRTHNSSDQMDLKWLNYSDNIPLHAPKVMAILKGYLYINDNSRLLRCYLDEPDKVEQIPIKDAQRLNDLAAGADYIVTSDTGSGKIYRMDLDQKITEIPSPPAVNGVTIFQNTLYCVSWGLHDIFECDLDGKEFPKPFGLAEYFVNLDGIEVLADGTFIVSDFTGNKVCSISPDRKVVTTLIELTSPADIGIDRQRGLLFIPQLKADRIVVCKIKTK